MKVLKYHFCTRINRGTAEQPQWEDVLSPVTMGWNEKNEEIARKEAWGGEYVVEDDGTEQTARETTEDRLRALEAAVQGLPGLIRAAVRAALTGENG